MSDAQHNYRRPAWLCLVDGEPWPCRTRRAAFLAKYPSDGMRLRGILGAQLLDAKRDLGGDGEELYQRFIGWTYQPAEPG